jgi:CheY-like chemotaxis protein
VIATGCKGIYTGFNIAALPLHWVNLRASDVNCSKILVIEDDSDIRNMFMLLLESMGYDVVGATNGKEGLEILAGIPGPCLILLDLMMPVMNGWEFLQAIRKDDVLAVNPVVILSAFSDQVKGEKVEAILKKPVDADALMKLVKKFC